MTSNYKTINRINSQPDIRAKLALTRSALNRGYISVHDIPLITNELTRDLFDIEIQGFPAAKTNDRTELKKYLAPLILFAPPVPDHLVISDYDALATNMYSAFLTISDLVSSELIEQSNHPEIHKKHFKILCMSEQLRNSALRELDITSESVQSLFIALSLAGIDIKPFINQKKLHRLKERINMNISDSFCHASSFFVNVSFMFKACSDQAFNLSTCKNILRLPDLYNYGIPPNPRITPRLPWVDWILSQNIETQINLFQYEALNTPFGVPKRALADFKLRLKYLVPQISLSRRLDLIRTVLSSFEDSGCHAENMLYRVASSHIHNKNTRVQYQKSLLKMVQLVCPETTHSIMLADSFDMNTPRSIRHFLDSLDVPEDKPQPLTDFIFE